MRLSTLKARGLRDAIKNGKTVEDICGKYQCTPNELFERIGRIYVHDDKKVKEMINRLETNGSGRKRKSTMHAVEETEEIIELDSDSDKNPSAAAKSADEVVADAVDGLERLRLIEARQSREVMDLESQHKSLRGQHIGCLRQLRDISDAIEQIRADFKQKCDEFDKIAVECNEFGRQMNDISARRREKLVALEETRQKIEELSRLTIFVYDDGDIVISDNQVVIPDDAESKNLFDELCEKTECEELKLREIRTLAKMIIIARSSSLDVEIVCDNETLEKTYSSLMLH